MNMYELNNLVQELKEAEDTANKCIERRENLRKKLSRVEWLQGKIIDYDSLIEALLTADHCEVRINIHGTMRFVHIDDPDIMEYVVKFVEMTRDKLKEEFDAL